MDLELRGVNLVVQVDGSGYFWVYALRHDF